TMMVASFTLLTKIPPGRKFAIGLIGGLFGLLAALLLGRAFYFTFAAIGRNLFAVSTFNSAFSGGLLLCVIGITLGFILLADERVMSELQRSRAELLTIAKALERSNVELESFAYATTHDLKEPLRTVSLYGQLLQRQGVDASANSLLQTIIGAAEHMEQ